MCCAAGCPVRERGTARHLPPVQTAIVKLFVAVRRAPRAATARFTPWFTPDGLRKENGLAPRSANPLILLAEWTGLEPATPGVTGRYSNQLNYHSVDQRWHQLPPAL